MTKLESLDSSCRHSPNYQEFHHLHKCLLGFKIYNSTPPPLNHISTAPNQLQLCQWRVSTYFSAPHYTAQIKKQSHIALWMQKYQSTIYRKVLLTLTLQSQTYSMLHTNTGNMYISVSACMHHHHAGSYALQYSTWTFFTPGNIIMPKNVLKLREIFASNFITPVQRKGSGRVNENKLNLLN